MRAFLFVVYDRAPAVYIGPMTFNTDAQAMRWFNSCVTNADHQFGKNPDDYTLMRCGLFDDQTAEIQPETATKIINGLEAVAQSRQLNGNQLDAFNKEIEQNGTLSDES